MYKEAPHLLAFLSAKAQSLGHLEAENIRAVGTKTLYRKLLAEQQTVQQTPSDQFKVVLLVGEDTPYKEELLPVILSHPYSRVLQAAPGNLDFTHSGKR